MFFIYEASLKMFATNKCVNFYKRSFSICYNFFELSSHKSRKFYSHKLHKQINSSKKLFHTVIQSKFNYGHYPRSMKNIENIHSRRDFIISSTDCVGFDQMVPKSSEEVQELLSKVPHSHPNSKLLKIAVIGVPNSGKSTLINQLIGWKVCSVSHKVHTTQCSARAVYNHDLTQLVFVDTPGIVTPEEIKKYNLKSSLVMDPEKSLAQSDLLVVMHDVANTYSHRSLHPRVLRALFLYPTIPSVLVLNKVDVIKKKTILLEIANRLTEGLVADTKVEVSEVRDISLKELAETLIASSVNDRDSKSSNDTTVTSSEECQKVDNTGEELPPKLNVQDVISGKIKPTEKEVQELIKKKKGWHKFREVFMLSALDGTGVEDLRNYLLNSAKRTPWIFHDDVVTDQSPQEIVLMTVREKCLEYLKHNIPYELKFKLSYWDLSDADLLSVMVSIYCRRKGHVKLFIGPKGKYVKRVAAEAEQDLRNIFRTEVRLRINFEYNPSITESDL